MATGHISKNVKKHHYIPPRNTHMLNGKILFYGCQKMCTYHLEITVDPEEEAVDKGEEEEAPDDIPRLYPFCSAALFLITE